MWHYTRQNILWCYPIFYNVALYQTKHSTMLSYFFIMWHYTRQNILWCYPIFYNVALYQTKHSLWCYPIFYNVALYQKKHSMMLSYFSECDIIPDKTFQDVILFFIMWHYTRQNTLWCYPIFYNVTLYQKKHSMMLSYFL